MKHLLLITILFTHISSLSAALKIGDSAPMTAYSMSDISGKEVSLESVAKENGVLVIFSCNTCPWVIAWEDRYNAVSETASKNGIGTIFVNSNSSNHNGKDSLKAMKAHAKEKQYNVLYALDTNNQLADAFGAQKTPDVFLFNKDSKLVYKGAIDDNARKPENITENYLINALNAVGSGKSVPVNTTKSLGCGIKR
tara:strand:+ start:121 stop:708 length:588 start_codon:yes stop_codon:yes gene_type:complete